MMINEVKRQDSELEWPYGLGEIKSIEGIEVTNKHRADAMDATECECLRHMDAAVSELSPGFRRYGATLTKIAIQFQNARGVIREEMTRIARRNLECVVTGNLQGRRVLNARLATKEKKARDKPVERIEPDPVGRTEPDPEVDPTPDFLQT